MRKKLTFKVPFSAKGSRLDNYLAQALVEQVPQGMSKSKVRKLIMAGAVHLNKKRIKIASKELIANATIEVFLDTDRLFNDKASLQKSYEVHHDDVLFEDRWLIAVNKPTGIPTQPTLDESRDHLYAAVQRFLSNRDRKSVYCGLHHRLDFDTSGVVLFTKMREANVGVAELFSERLAQKTYRAVSWNPNQLKLPKTWEIANHLGRAGKTGKDRMRITAVKSGGDFAETHFELLKDEGSIVVLSAKPKTGRTHQIRVHLSEYGLPIAGDPIYGMRDREPERAPRLMLHAYRLEFPHPMTGSRIVIEAPLPEGFEL